jgi:hypothetical protein
MVTVDLSHYYANQSEWGRAFSALGRRAQKSRENEAREYGELAVKALRRAIQSRETIKPPASC